MSAIPSSRLQSHLSISLFPTALGWIGLAGSQQGVSALVFGHDGPLEAREALSRLVGEEVELEDWSISLRNRLEAFADGIADDFADVKLNLPKLTPFQSRVIGQVRQVGFGETITYGELATRSGNPGAARAVGTVMSHNRIPLMIPCHRVIGRSGRLCGFSAPDGISMKQRLLQLEGSSLTISSKMKRPLVLA